MIELPDDSKLQLSRVSDYSSAALCGGRVRLRGEEGYDPTPSTALVKGSVMHMLIWYRMTNDTASELSQTEMVALAIEFFIEVYTRDAGEPPPLSKTEIQAIVSPIVHGYKRWVKEVMPDFTDPDLLVEHMLYAQIRNQRWLRGTPDVIDLKDRRIHDWKTAARPWSQAKADSEIQPAAYAWLVDENTAVTVDEFVFWIYAWGEERWQKLPTQVSPERIDAFETLARGSDPMKANFRPQSGLFNSPRGWWCQPKFCNAWDACKVKHIIADGKADLPALTRTEKLA